MRRQKGRLPSKKPDERTAGTSSSLSDVEARLRVRSMLPVSLEYSPFESPANMKRVLADLVTWILAGRVHHRQASAIRGLLRAWIDVDLHEKLPELIKRVEALEKGAEVKSHDKRS